jgi:hypothetical protein
MTHRRRRVKLFRLNVLCFAYRLSPFAILALLTSRDILLFLFLKEILIELSARMPIYLVSHHASLCLMGLLRCIEPMSTLSFFVYNRYNTRSVLNPHALEIGAFKEFDESFLYTKLVLNLCLVLQS